MMGVRWIEQNNHQILYFDHRGLKPDEVIENLKVGNQMVANIDGDLCVLSNFEGATVDATVMQFLKTSGAEVMEPILDKTAIVGIRGIRHVLLQAYNSVTGAGQNQRLFDTEEEALAWLASEG
jgi:hypothetical protein